MLTKLKKYFVTLLILLFSLQSLMMTLFSPTKAMACVVCTNGTGEVVINELMWMGSNASTSDEWIELHNMTNSAFYFSQTPFSIYKNDVLLLTINSGTLNANSFFLISRQLETSNNSVLNVAPDLQTSAVVLNNSDVQYKLYYGATNAGLLLDTADDGAGAPLKGDNTNKFSMERNSVPGDGTLAANWHTATTSVGFDAGATEKGTPRTMNGPDVPTPDSTKISVVQNAPGTEDKILGQVGAVENNATVKAYSDAGLTTVVGTTQALADGSFLLSVGDNLHANLFVTQMVDAVQSSAIQLQNDITPPTGSMVINNNEGVTNNVNVQLNITRSLDAIQMKIEGDGMMNATIDSFIDFFSPVPFTLNAGKGVKTVKVTLRDAAGNVSAQFSDSIYLNTNSSDPIETQIPNTGEFSAVNAPELSATVTTSAPTFMTVSTYPSNPEAALPTGISSLGKFYDFSMPNQTSLTLPVTLKIYYTLQDLANANVSDENKLQGIYYFDFTANMWKLFDGSSVNTTDIMFNGVSYAGFVSANVNNFSLISLTPLTVGTDITAPVKPANITANSGDGQVELKWDKVDDAVGYYVRYRKSTNVDNVNYTTVFLSGRDTLSTKITGLINDTEYEFGVAAKDAAGNIGEFGVVVQTSKKAAVTETTTTTTASETKTTKKTTFTGTAKAAEIVKEKEKSDEEIKTTSPEEGEVKAAEEEQEGINWSRLLVTLGILILAIGAGYGGYYGYQWWMGGAKETEDKGEKEKKNKDKGGRW